MLQQVSLAQIAQVLSATAVNCNFQELINGVTTDSRNIHPGNLFVALQGENFDGHNFAVGAIADGAIACVCSTSPSDNIPHLLVQDTLVAYQTLGRWWREQFKIPVIAITGSVGKTTTKELIASVLATQGKVLKTQANYNNEIGVPKTLLELSSDDKFAVIEMAMRGRGQIAELAQIAVPTIGIITNVGTAHIGLLGSEQAISEAKCELLAEMPSDSVAILNNDDARLMQTAATVWQGKTITYGLTGGDINGELIASDTLKVGDLTFNLPLAGKHNALNYLAALAVAQVLNIDWTSLQSGVEINMPSGRSQRYDLPNDISLLDETYNAGLESMLAALELLAETPGTRRIAVLGTMKELGTHSETLHQRVGAKAAQLPIDKLLVLVDDAEAQAIATAATGMMVECFPSHDLLTARLRNLMQSGDRILFKASHSVGLDRIVQALRQ
ncbi:UDP-N-acetylmuramoyl-tripeptide--D-alanyl-D-alanine ligase [Merismopedia glauca]|uniref:UDP-N-acetylmuramoyl-tripeptide--D-alanyl-D-alanine ligase n=1 Tax=Merismopedia glauca CCAP 1448/3 TaxID=1296344 RepID=A0A2T1C4M5_9CYAN|nr:UDP-N-acetylmuramoyl-tripeptide--D-alanyl-D-alanine ligase [Merismopedia glauca]PSB03209.1 UDP-N-acetylmuramoyl-tripeptide--D-alanyl-D-alanine ligase [Merismopedia glauca CCAP 1448/3]